MRKETWKNGVLIGFEDTRTVAGVKALKIASIKAACAAAIGAAVPSWMIEREVLGGTPVPQDLKDLCATYRAHSNDLEAEVMALAAGVENDDKAVCDAIETVNW